MKMTLAEACRINNLHGQVLLSIVSVNRDLGRDAAKAAQTTLASPANCLYSGANDKTRRLRTDAMPMDAAEIETLIRTKFPDATVEIKDLAGDGDHFAANVVSSAFTGKSRVQQHQMVYDALGGRMGGVLHALALTTAAPPS
jgi:stress-induced morphogen